MRSRRGAVLAFAVMAGLGWSLVAVDRSSAASNLVRITSALEPATVTIAPGDSITWRNDDSQRHRMRSTSGPTEFDSGDLDPGESYTVTLSALGTYKYRDDRDKDLSNYWGTVVVAVPTASASPGTTGGALPAPADATIRMAGRAFGPSTVTIAVGGSVTWLNDDSREHTATSSSNVFDSGLMAPGATFARVFTAVGTFSYLCLIHPDMTGSVVVSGLPGTTPPPATPAPAPTPVPPAGAADVEIVDFAFNPGDFTVDAGTRVTFANRGAALHTVTAQDGSFDSGLIRAAGTYQRVFATPGTFPYLCALHPTMSGTIRVRGANGATPPPQPRPTPVAAVPPGSVRIVDFAFLPSQFRVSVGSTVTWVNAGVAPHTVTARGGEFDSGLMASRASFSHRFSRPGTFTYLCAIHPDMTGTLLVAASDGSVPPPLPTRAPPPPASAPPGVTDVHVVDLAFEPAVVSIPVGGTIRFTNLGVAIHTATALDGSFDSGFLSTSESWERTFDAPGAFEYLCALHPSMVGTIVVGNGAAGGPSGSGEAPQQGGGGTGTDPGNGSGAGSGSGPGAGPDKAPGDTAAGSSERSPASIALGLAFILAAIGGALAVVRGIGQRAARSA